MNRRTLMTVLGGASLMTAIPALGQTQIADADRTGVQGWLDECADAWATSDAERMFRSADDDVEWVNIVGMHWRGKAQVVGVHALYLNTMFKGVPMSLKSIESVRSVGPDVVIAVVRWSVGQFSPPDGSIVPASDDRMTLVSAARRRDCNWSTARTCKSTPSRSSSTNRRDRLRRVNAGRCTFIPLPVGRH